MKTGYDVLIIGSGIVGLAHAYHAVKKGLSVAVVEKNSTQIGASIRNFGNFWPIGQIAQNGDFEKAMYGRQVYLDLSEKAGFWVEQCGSWHLGNTNEELAVFEEFLQKGNPLGFQCEMLSKKQLEKDSHLINLKNVDFALLSKTECRINPRKTIPAIAAYLKDKCGVDFYYNTQAQGISYPKVETTAGTLQAERILVCTGYEAWQFYKMQLEALNIEPSRLQMTKTVAQPKSWNLHTSVATGLSCRHYKSFSVCTETLPALQDYVAARFPELDQWGIHLLVTQNDEFEAVIGDSHEYGEPLPFSREIIDEIFVKLANQYLNIPNYTIAERWMGIYLKYYGDKSYFRIEPEKNVQIVNGLGGNGMTLSFGVAKETTDNW
jgi:FAD dependent oxidoreductase TIGR03364